MADLILSQFNNAILNIGDGSINLDTDVFKIGFLSGYTFNAADDQWSDVSSFEIAAGDGYLTGGLTCPNTSWTAGSGVTRFECDDVVLTAEDTLPAFDGVVLYSSTSGKLLVHGDCGESIILNNTDQFMILIGANGLLYFDWTP